LQFVTQARRRGLAEREDERMAGVSRETRLTSPTSQQQGLASRELARRSLISRLEYGADWRERRAIEERARELREARALPTPPEPAGSPHYWWSERHDPTKPPSQPIPAGYHWEPSEKTMQDGSKTFFWALVSDDTGAEAPAAYDTGYGYGETGGEEGGYGYEDYGPYYDYGGGGGGSAVPEVEPLGELSWWSSSDVIQPLLRNWAIWLQELVEANRLMNPIPNPFSFDEEAAKLAEKAEPSAVSAVPTATSSEDILRRLKELLQLDFSKGETKTQQWQKVIDKIPSAGLEAQQLLTSLRFDPDAGRWYTAPSPQIVNPAYI
jgi:hypothetical protein